MVWTIQAHVSILVRSKDAGRGNNLPKIYNHLDQTANFGLGEETSWLEIEKLG